MLELFGAQACREVPGKEAPGATRLEEGVHQQAVVGVCPGPSSRLVGTSPLRPLLGLSTFASLGWRELG